MMRCHLSNGVPVDVFAHSGLSSVTWSMWMGGGSRDEGETELGACHLLEHVLAAADEDGSSYAVLAESLGGEGNALTSKDHVVFFATTSPADIDAVARLSVANIVEPPMSDDVVRRERSLVRSELKEAAADPYDYVYDRWGVEAFGRDPFARPTGGTLADIDALTTEQLVAAHRRRVHTGNLRVVVLGDIDPDRAVALAEDSALADLEAGDWRPGGCSHRLDAEPELGDHDEDAATDVTVLMVGGVGPGADDADGLAAATVADMILGGSPASLLVDRIRHERALAYQCHSSYTAFRDRGLWRATVVTGAQDAAAVLDEVRSVVGRALDHLTSDEIDRGRRAAVGRYLLSRDRWFDHMIWVGDAVEAGWQGSVDEEFLRRLREVDATVVRSTLAGLFDGGIVQAAAGDLRGCPARGRLEVR